LMEAPVILGSDPGLRCATSRLHLLKKDLMQQLEFTLNGEFVELNQLLKLVGICDSGGAGKMLVAAGGVSVDGVAELRKTAKIRAGQVVTLGDLRIVVKPAAS
jgi:ribosome-associated protein